MIDSDELLVGFCGASKVKTFKEVKRTSMTLARAVKDVIADDLHGSLPPHGKQFLTTNVGVYRLASRANTDNTTEERSHREAGAELVQVFDDISPVRQQRGWITVAELYAQHGQTFDQEALRRKVAERLGFAG